MDRDLLGIVDLTEARLLRHVLAFGRFGSSRRATGLCGIFGLESGSSASCHKERVWHDHMRTHVFIFFLASILLIVLEVLTIDLSIILGFDLDFFVVDFLRLLGLALLGFGSCLHDSQQMLPRHV